MVITNSRRVFDPAPPPVAVKFVISGGFGVGKTTFVTSASEIEPVVTEGRLSRSGRLLDDPSLLTDKATTTVALDFGRLTVDHGLRLYLFGTPGQDRFGFMWDDLLHGALGAMVLVDPRRLDEAFPAIDYFESRGVPFVVVLNHFDTRYRPDRAAIRYALNVDDAVPVVDCDARDGWSVRAALVVMLDHLLAQFAAA